MSKRKDSPLLKEIEKARTGIAGFDEITGGGLPAGRPSLVCGSAGCGKSLFAVEFLVRGAIEENEPGVLMSFEETSDDIKKNVASLGFDLEALIAQKKIVIDHIRIERHEIEENGDYDLEGLFIRLDYAVRSIGARRVVLDTIETLFSGLSNQAILRMELRRLFTWLRDRHLTTVITGERGDGQLTRQGLEEYVSDCVVLLDHRVQGQISTRRLRVVKYRGSTHGTNEFPFLIDEDGITVFPITSATLDYAVSDERVSTGIKELDAMLGGEGLYRGSTVLLSGTAGTGKTTVAAHLAHATCRAGERALYFSFEESPAQIIRNMRHVGLDLERHVRSGRLKFHSSRPTMQGLEMHLARMLKMLDTFRPSVVIIDPMTNLATAGTMEESTAMLIRLVDALRKRGITALLISLTGGGRFESATDVSMSSVVDTWLLLRDIELNGERNRALYVLKSRGMAHSNQVREFLITSKGVRLVPVYLGTAGVLTGTARLNQEAAERTAEILAAQESERRRRAFEQRRKATEAQIEAIRASLAAEEAEYRWNEEQQARQSAATAEQLSALALSRQGGHISRNNGGS